jgi:FkbM family methyltransferase
MTPVWYRVVKHVLGKGRPPSAKRVRIWRARAAFERAARALGPGDVAIDCGANVGRYTEPLARSGAVVHAFEPDPTAFAALSARLSGRPNVTLHPAAVGVTDGTATLYRAADFAADPLKRTVSSSLLPDKLNVDAEAALEVRRVDLPRFIAEIGRVALLKLDIEGAEVEILERLLEIGALARIGAVFVETHETKAPALAERTAALRRAIARDGLAGVNLDWA